MRVSSSAAFWDRGFKETVAFSGFQQSYIPSIPFNLFWRLFMLSTFCDNEGIRTSLTPSDMRNGNNNAYSPSSDLSWYAILPEYLLLAACFSGCSVLLYFHFWFWLFDLISSHVKAVPYIYHAPQSLRKRGYNLKSIAYMGTIFHFLSSSNCF